MTAFPVPITEKERLNDLHELGILDSPNENDFDQLVELASLICQCNMSLVSLVDGERQWFKAKKNIADQEMPRSESICAHAIMNDELFIVENTLNDQRFVNLPAVQNELHLRFYAGAPIISSNGYALGTVCVLHEEPRELNEMQKSALRSLARQASVLFEFRKKNKDLKELAAEQERLKTIAEVATRSQKLFLSTMSHEIRTPLNGIVGMTNILLTENPSPLQKEYLNSLKFSSDNLVAIVNDVLDYNKITSTEMVFENIDFNLRRLLTDFSKPHAVAARAKNIDLEISISDSVPEFVKGDSTRLIQVLNNLTGNAVKFTKQGGVTIEVSCVGNSKEKTDIRFIVKDTGIGIAAGEMEAIFDQFSQANASITRHFGGTGLGLAICKNLLHLQGSEIKVTSVQGQGSHFFFTLGFDKATVVTKSLQELPEDVKLLKGLRVLVVEDNKVNWVVLNKYLSGWEVNADHAENGAVAIEMITAVDYDMVFMDIQMPVMDGETATKKLRTELGYNKPVIAITANAYNNEEDLEGPGFSGSILKPFQKKELAATMINLFKSPEAASN